ncbi:DAK2 domain-containing protein [Nocardia yamanashiensis]|uniref:DAK2 domain-containing protein n=1 Tax=Nocardia yamanashiensis TaxID=209247 RepID=UPI001E41F33F|nr:DAK2 domain-containing protein [Nocardia yamanashiensis]UGT42048.1 DAK2 domain-containing protein [Nocardia yamanashiensis]
MPGEGDVLDGPALLRWGQLSLAGLERHRDEINALNVFPVPDSDTGTNLLATMRAAVRSAEAAVAEEPDRPAGRAVAATEGSGSAESVAALVSEDATDRRAGAPLTPAAAAVASAREVASVMARAATLGARGNSGIILSQVLRGVADVVRDGPLTEASLRLALRRAARLVREALSSPVEGTMLTVLDRAAESAADCPDRTLSAVAVAAADGAAKALGETPEQLGVLRDAGVVDAGARGLLVLLDELVTVAGGSAPQRPEYVRRAPESGPGPVINSSNTVGTAGDSRMSPGALPLAGVDSVLEQGKTAAAGADAVQYEVMYVLGESDESRVGGLRDRLAELGDSVVVVGDGAGSWSAHVHCADAGAAVEAGLAAGRLSGIRIETLAASAHAPGGAQARGILAVASGAGAVRLFQDAGAEVLEGEVTAEALLEGIRRLPHREVLVLPNGALPAHELVAVSVAARDGQREVLMLPCGSMVQGLAALSMHDAGRIAVDDAFAMSEAAAGTRWGALRIAPERALTIVGTCAAGDGLGLVGHDVVVIDADVRNAGRTLLDRMLGLGGELVTMLLGAEAPEGLSEELSAHVTAGFPGVEVVVYPGGQAGDLVQIGVE